MPHNRLPRVMKHYSPSWQTFEDFWIRETGTDQQVAQLHDRYTMMMMTMSQLQWEALSK